MCRMFSHQPQSNYESDTRSLRVGGHSTSIRLENVFWSILEEMAAREATTLGRFVTALHDEVLLHHGELSNLASLLRCSCMIYVSQVGNPRRLPTAQMPPVLTAAE